MFPSTSLLAFVLLALTASVSASPLAGREARTTNRVALPFTTKFTALQHGGGNGTGHAILQADLARIAHMNTHGKKIDEHFKLANGSTSANHKRASYSFGVTNAAVTYTASVGVGSPATQYTLVIDTGSSNTWVGANKKYATTSTSRNTGNAVSVSYGSGSFSGTQYTDRVTLSSNLVIPQQSIGVASTSQGFQGVDGILGVGPTVLTSGTVKNTGTVPTVTDNLFAQHSISTDLLTVYFNPTTSQSTKNGVLGFGGVDSAYHVGDVTYAPLTRTSPARYYWGIDQSVNYGGKPVLATTAGIVDTGTTLIYLATDAYDKYVAYTGATADSATGFLRIAPAQYKALQNLNFVVAGRTFALTPNGQIWPRALNGYIGGSSDYVYLVVGDLGSRSGGGLDFINGYAFLERFLSVYDSGAGRVGLATTRYTGAQTN